MKTLSKTHLLWMSSAAVLALMTSTQVLAAEKAADDNTIIVTAQKREQKLQEVPIVVQTLSSRVLQDAGVRDIKDMQILTPGLTVTSTQNETLTTARIRGVGTVGDNPGLESSVGVMIDGVYRPRNGVGFDDLGELERIEILKGPQGSVFGKNTSAGVINILSKKPQFKFGADGELTVGDYGLKGVAASVTGAITPELAGRLYVASRQRDGYNKVKNGIGPSTRTNDMTQNFQTIRGQLLFVPNDRLEARLIMDWSHRDEYCCTAVPVRVSSTASVINALTANSGITTSTDIGTRTAYSNRSTHQKVNDFGFTVEANYKLDAFGGSTLTSITGVRDWETISGQDIDYTGADILYRADDGSFGARFKTLSQELRLAGGNDKVQWMVGAFYSDEDLNRKDAYLYGSNYESYLGLLMSSGASATYVSALTGLTPGQSFRAGEGARDTYNQSAKSTALFTNNSFKLTDKLELTVGARATTETKKVQAQYVLSDGGAACGAAATRAATSAGAWALVPLASRSTLVGYMCLPWTNVNYANRLSSESLKGTNTSGTVKLAYHFTDDIMAYASTATGYKAGGFNLDRVQVGITPATSLAFKPETVTSDELGLKTVLFDKALTLNITYFDQRYKNFQLNSFLGTAFTVETIPTLTSKGIDLDFYWKTPIKGLNIQGGVSNSDTKYGQFTASQLNIASNYAQLSLLPGATMSFAPEWTQTLSASWTGTLHGLRTTANLTAKNTDSYNTGSDLLPYKAQSGYSLVNGRFTIGAPDRRWTVELWGNNLTDVKYKQVVFNAPLQGSAFQTTVQTTGSNPGTYYNQSLDTQTYMAFLGAPKTMGMTLRLKY